jgi:hypothetical protein
MKCGKVAEGYPRRLPVSMMAIKDEKKASEKRQEL